MVLILSFGFDVQIHLSGIAEALEEMQEHLRRHLANLLTVELCVPNQPGATTEVQAYGTETVVHRQGIAIALNASLVAQCSEQTLAQRQSSILDGVVLVNVQVAFHADGQIHHAVFANLFQHVVEESQSRLNVAVPVSVQVHLDIDVCFLGGALNFCRAFSAIGNGSHLVPVAHL